VSEHQVLVMGQTKTGKTTFIAAMFDVVETEKVAGSLVLDGVDGNQQHLNEIRDAWADCREISRTVIGKEKVVSVTLRERGSGVKGRIALPDMDGEAFERQWSERAWPKSHKEITESCDSALLFIHPARVKTGALIRDTKRPIAALGGDTPPPRPETAGTPDAGKKFTPTQVQLVELLQFVRWVKQGLSEFRLGVIVSAWDVVMKQGNRTPKKWLQTQLPMLHQFLTANRESICSRVYGVSAQGGDIVKDADKLRKRKSPSERIIVVEETTQSSDITIPVRWVLGMSER
jgi:Double-GTPase 1